MKKIFVRRKYPGWRQIRHFIHINKYDVMCDAKADPRNVAVMDLSIVDWKYHTGGCVGHYAHRVFTREWVELYIGGEPNNGKMRYTVWRREKWILNDRGKMIPNPEWLDPNDAPPPIPKKKRKIFIPKSVFHSTPLPLP